MFTCGKTRVVEIIGYKLAWYVSLFGMTCAFEVPQAFLAEACVREDKNCICFTGDEEGIEECGDLVVQLAVRRCVKQEARVCAEICSGKGLGGREEAEGGGGCAGKVEVKSGWRKVV